MIKTRSANYKYIEQELSRYYELKKIKNEIEEELINPHTEEDENIGGGSSGLVVSQTEIKAMRLLTDRRLAQIEKVVTAIEDLYLESTDGERALLELWYFDKPRRFTADGAAMQLNISLSGFHKRKKKLVIRLADKLGLNY